MDASDLSMPQVIKAWTSRISSCEFVTMTLWDDGVEMEMLRPGDSLRNLVSYEDVRNGALDFGVRNDFGEEVLRELRLLVG